MLGRLHLRQCCELPAASSSLLFVSFCLSAFRRHCSRAGSRMHGLNSCKSQHAANSMPHLTAYFNFRLLALARVLQGVKVQQFNTGRTGTFRPKSQQNPQVVDSPQHMQQLRFRPEAQTVSTQLQVLRCLGNHRLNYCLYGQQLACKRNAAQNWLAGNGTNRGPAGNRVWCRAHSTDASEIRHCREPRQPCIAWLQQLHQEMNLAECIAATKGTYPLQAAGCWHTKSVPLHCLGCLGFGVRCRSELFT